MFSYQYLSFTFTSWVPVHRGGLGKCRQVLFLVILLLGQRDNGSIHVRWVMMKVWWRVWFVPGPHKLLQCLWGEAERGVVSSCFSGVKNLENLNPSFPRFLCTWHFLNSFIVWPNNRAHSEANMALPALEAVTRRKAEWGKAMRSVKCYKSEGHTLSQDTNHFCFSQILKRCGNIIRQ